jgi:quinol monooxygenase YgiN
LQFGQFKTKLAQYYFIFASAPVRTGANQSRIPRIFGVEQKWGEIFMVKKGLAVKLVAKPGKEADVEAFLNSGLALVAEEPLTITWYAVKFSENTFGIFDTFEGDEGRDAHLNGKVAEALMANAGELLAEPPTIEKIDVLAVKNPEFMSTGATG